ncbi:putative mercuric transport protein [Caballeronia arationis]|uniref:Mercuric transport protein MerT n=1 Tax=Caballeronia arationis TaxID=1777142 RepID=A0A7Z7IE93_9BURK|nr:putative mercuric transport protein [Caballeronia arationis]SOE89060.1 MerT mercuric transport protein [Caballeronia arationis]
MAQLTGKGSLITGVLAAIGASVCCVAPLVLLALGIGGMWMRGFSPTISGRTGTFPDPTERRPTPSWILPYGQAVR